MKTSMMFSIKFEKMVVMHLLKVVGALQSPNDILLKANVPYGHVKVVLSWSSGLTIIWLYP